MEGIKATWTNGQIVPAEPVNWPEGIPLFVEPTSEAVPSEKLGLTEDEWKDDPESIAEWIKWVDTVEPTILSDDERADMERFREEQRRFNIEAVRRQMNLGADA